MLSPAHGSEAWTTERVAAFINEQRNIAIATTRPAGQPHAAVVLGGSVHDELFFTVNEQSFLARNLRANDRIGFYVAAGAPALMGQGSGRSVGRADGSVSAIVDTGPRVGGTHRH